MESVDENKTQVQAVRHKRETAMLVGAAVAATVYTLVVTLDGVLEGKNATEIGHDVLHGVKAGMAWVGKRDIGSLVNKETVRLEN